MTIVKNNVSIFLPKQTTQESTLLYEKKCTATLLSGVLVY